MSTLVLVRHGESLWNLLNLFTGWADIGLTDSGYAQAKAVGKILAKKEVTIDKVFTSQLVRSWETLEGILSEVPWSGVPIEKSWRLNERHYGRLQGKSKFNHEFTDDQVHIWRRSYDVAPPKLDWNDQRHPRFDIKYQDIQSHLLPSSESLKDTFNRLLPYWLDTIEPLVKEGQNIMIVAHGNSLRALIKHLEAISDSNVISLNVPNAVPYLYTWDSTQGWKIGGTCEV